MEMGLVFLPKIFEQNGLFLFAHDFSGPGVHKMHARASGAGHRFMSVVVRFLFEGVTLNPKTSVGASVEKRRHTLF
jgi:hypothetical protein